MRTAARAACAAAIVTLTGAGCSVLASGDGDKAEKRQSEDRIPSAILKPIVRTAQDKDGKTLWTLRAREGRVFDRENRTYLTDFLLFFYRDGRAVSKLNARRGIVDRKAGVKVTARRLVYLRSEIGRTLETEELFLDNQKNIIWNEVWNRITREDGSVVVGTHLWAHNDLKIFKLKDARGETPAERMEHERRKKGLGASTNSAASNTRATNRPGTSTVRTNQSDEDADDRYGGKDGRDE